jgi:hypothetical protein
VSALVSTSTRYGGDPSSPSPTNIDAILRRIRARWQEIVHAHVSTLRDPTAQLARLFDGYVARVMR